ncbi:hypothetical protein D3C74_386030 [compost metagenome]
MGGTCNQSVLHLQHLSGIGKLRSFVIFLPELALDLAKHHGNPYRLVRIEVGNLLQRIGLCIVRCQGGGLLLLDVRRSAVFGHGHAHKVIGEMVTPVSGGKRSIWAPGHILCQRVGLLVAVSQYGQRTAVSYCKDKVGRSLQRVPNKV